MKKMLVIGGTGFLGKNFLEIINKEKYEVTVITRNICMDDFINYRGNILDHKFVENIIKKVRADILVLFAWDVKSQSYWHSMENNIWVNTTLYIAEKFLENGGTYLVFSGTSASYDYENRILVEDKKMEHPNTVYGLSKLYTSNILKILADRRGAKYMEARLFSIFGMYERQGRLMTNTIDCLLKDQKVINNKWKLQRDYIYVKDAVRAILYLMDMNAEGIYNISSGIAIAIKDILETIALKLGKTDLLHLIEFDGEGEYLYIRGDNSKLSDTGFTCKYSLEEAIMEEIEWYRFNMIT